MILKYKQSWKYLFIYMALIIAPSATYALTPSQVFEKAQDSIVVVYTYDAKEKKIAQGSGVLISTTRIATNCHVLEDGTSFEVVHNGLPFPVKVYAGDSVKDICLLDSKNTIGNPAILGSATNLKVGEPVYAIGAPKGMELSLSDGIVSQLRGGNPPIIQTTAAISPGSSGGGLFDSKARLVGLTTSTRIDSQSINFAMPVEYLTQIKTNKKSIGKQRTLNDWLVYAAVLEENKKWNELLAWGELWVKAKPDSSLALAAIAVSYGNLGEYEQAIVFYSKALAVNPNDAGVYNNRGVAYGKLGDYNKEINDYTQAIKIYPNHTHAYFNRAVAYVVQGNYRMASKDARKACELGNCAFFQIMSKNGWIRD